MIEAGFGRVDITPPLGIRLGGYGVPERPAEAVHDPLAATALVLRQGTHVAAQVTLDLCLLSAADMDRLRQAAAGASGISPERINIGVSHSHSSPQTFSMPGWGDKDEAYLRDLEGKVALAVRRARDRCVEARMGVATIPTKVGVNRRWVGGGPEAQFGANEFGAYDSTMTVVRFESATGTLGTLVHCAAHCTAMGINRLISRDWAGVMIDRVESQTKAPVIFINGAFGDVGPRTNALTAAGLFNAAAGDGVHSVNECGYLAAGDALRAFASIKRFDPAPELRVVTGKIQLPLKPLAPVEAARRELERWAPKKDEWGMGMCQYSYWQRVLAAHEQAPRTHLDFQQTIVGLGPLALVPIPGEPFTSISLRLRALSPMQHTLVCGCTNGALSYLSDREGRARGGYEIWSSISLLTQMLADDSDDALVNANVALLRKLAETISAGGQAGSAP